jgi:hypothetical protein
MGSHILFADSSTSVSLDPEYDFKDSGKKIEKIQRARDGSEYRYKWGDYNAFKFSLMYVNSSDKYQLNLWWNQNTNLTFTQSGSGVEYAVRITNKSKPIDGVIEPYLDQFEGKIELGEY